MADEVIWQLTIDGSEALATLDEIDAGLQALDEQISQVGASSDSLVGLDDILTALQGITDTLTIGFNNLDESILSMDGTLAGVAAGVDTLDASLQTIDASIGALDSSLAGMAAAEEGVAAETDTVSMAMDGLNAAIGPLTMIASLALMAGQQMFQMGTQAQDGFNLVKDMAGASDADMQKLETTAVQLGVGMKEASTGMYQVESAGYAGADAILVFSDAEKAAKASGADASSETSALTSILHAYTLSAKDAGTITDTMTEAIVLGKQSAGDFASSIGPLAAAGHNVGLSFDEVAAAESTMTQINPKVAQDAQQLRFLFNATSLSIDGVAATAKKLHIAFDETQYKSLDLIGRLQYLEKQAGGPNTEAFKKLVGGSAGLQAALALLSGNSETYRQNLEKLKNSAGTTDEAFKKYQEGVQAHLDQAGASISKFALDAVNKLGPYLTPIIDNITKAIGQFTDLITNHTQQAMPILAGLAAIIGGALLGAVIALVASMWPVLAVLLALGAVVAGVVYAFQHWGDIMKQVNSWLQIPALQVIWQLLQGAASFLVSTFTPVWLQLVNVFNSQIKPAFLQLWGTIQQIMPELKMLGMFIGAILIVDIGLFVGAIGGIVGALAGLLQGLATAIGGIVQIFTGIVQTVSGIVAFIVDLCTGHFNKLGGDLKVIFGGIQNIFSGFGNVVRGIFEGLVKGVTGLFSGFSTSIVGYFNTILHGVQNHTQQAKDDATRHSLEMKDKYLQHVEQMDVQSIMKLDHMRVQIEQKLRETKDAATRHALEMKLKMIEHSEQTRVGVLHAHQQMRQQTESELDKLKKGASDKFQSIQKDIQNIVGNVTKWLQNTWKNAVDGVTNSFKWLYDHNYYFHDLVDKIKQIIEDCKKWLEDAWNNISKAATDAWNNLVKSAQDAWNRVSQPFKDAWSQYIQPPLSSLLNNITNWFNDLKNQAVTWGQNLIQGFIDGINNMAGAAGNAAQNIAKNVASFLGFHSPSEQGPGATADQWAPALMNMFISGIEQSQQRLKQTVASTAQILTGLQTRVGAQLNASVNVNAPTAGVPLTPALQTLSLPPLQSNGAFGGNNPQVLNLLSLMLQSMQRLEQKAGTGTTSTILNNNTINAPAVNPQQLYNQLQSMGGFGYQDLVRGSYGL